MSKIKQSFLMETDEFKDFKLFFRSLVDVCENVCFLDGKVMQTSNDKTLVLGCDLSGIFRIKGKFMFSKIESIYKKLAIFNRYSPIIFVLYDDKLEMSDGVLLSEFKEPVKRDSKNKTMSLQAINGLFGNQTRVMEAKLQKELCRRVATACEVQNSNCVFLRIINNVAYLSTSSQAMDMQSEFKLQHSLMKEMTGVGIRISTILFRYKKDAVMNVYLSDDESMVLVKSEVEISKRIIMDAYGRSNLDKIEN
jgi:hypothetical protein